MLITCQCYSAKVAPNTNRLNFARNNLKNNKLKAFTLTLHVKIRNLFISKNRVFIIVMLFETNHFFRFI